MTAGAGHALEQALAYYRTPALLSVAANRRLPDDVLDLIRLAAGDETQLARCSAASGESAKRVQDAAVFFVQQVLFAPGADQHRVLGVNPDASVERMREHYRWLIRWLHPDRNADDWDSVYADRVVRAWQSLRRLDASTGRANPESRSQGTSGGSPVEPVFRVDAASMAPVSGRMAGVNYVPATDPLISPGTARRLPAFVLGGLVLAAVSAVGLLWVLQQPPRHTPSEALGSPPDGVVPVVAVSEATRDVESLSADPTGNESVVPEASAQETSAVPAPLATQPAADNVASADLASPGPVNRDLVGGTSVPIAVVPSEVPSKSPPSPLPAPVPDRIAPAAVAIGPEGPPTVGAAAPPAPPTTLQEAKAHALLGQFSAAYAAGDINALMHLFTRDASNNRGGRDAIVYDYQSLFSDSKRRELRLEPRGWIERGDSAVLLAHYEARVSAGLLRGSHDTRGEIRFSLREEDGQLKISQVIHE